jgi:hypothetical protein
MNDLDVSGSSVRVGEAPAILFAMGPPELLGRSTWGRLPKPPEGRFAPIRPVDHTSIALGVLAASRPARWPRLAWVWSSWESWP